MGVAGLENKGAGTSDGLRSAHGSQPAGSKEDIREAVVDIVTQMRRQAGLFVRLEGLARRQRLLVAQEDTRPLLVLLSERQKLVVELTEVSRTLAPARRDWRVVRETLCSADREEADGLLDEMQQSLGRILAGDEEDARCLAIRKQMVRKNLQNVRFSGSAVGIYRPGPAMAGRRLDEHQ